MSKDDSRNRKRLFEIILLIIFMAPLSALAEEQEEKVDPDRLEPTIFPAIAGNTDVGVLLGALGMLAKFEEGYDPYRWKGAALAVFSLKQGPDGIESPAHNYFVKFDVPGLADGRLRLFPSVSFERKITERYFGLGNASMNIKNGAVPVISRQNLYKMSGPQARLNAWIKLIEHLHVLSGIRFRYLMPSTYDNSTLQRDMNRTLPGEDPYIYGTRDHAALQFALGLIYDTRDHETCTSSGMFHELSFRLTPGAVTDNDLLFGGAFFNTRYYVPIENDSLVLAFRLLGDFQTGTVPFYELSNAGGFNSIDFSGSKGIRGLPMGRYHGKVKVMGTVELRSMLWPFSILGQRLRPGFAFFVDSGRIWNDYEYNPDLDGTGIGIKYGFGLGPRLQWGETVMIRFDFAYAPEASEFNPDLPIGIYMDMKHSF